MPLYEYFCENCKISFECLSRKDILTKHCPKCDNLSNKIISKANFKIMGYSYSNGYSEKNPVQTKRREINNAK